MSKSSAASSASSSAGGAQEFDLNSLPLGQLQQVRQQLEEELQYLASSQSQLRLAIKRFEDSIESLSSIAKAKEGTEILVPLTSSIYVPGTVANEGKVIVDIGTGYYVEKTAKDAEAFFTRRVSFIQGNIDGITKALASKRTNYNALVDLIQKRTQQQQQQQLAAQKPSGAVKASA